MAHSLSRTNLTIKSLSIKDGNETDNYILVSDAIGVANWRKPSNYIADKPNDHYIGELFGGGVVVAVWQENGIEKCLVAAPEIISGFVSNGLAFPTYGTQWGQYSLDGGNFAKVGASYNSFGASNSSIISSFVAPLSYPRPYFASDACVDYINPDLETGIWDDWFMPSIYELNHLINNTAIFNKVLESYATFKGIGTKDIVYRNWNSAFSTFYWSPINLVEFGATEYLTDLTNADSTHTITTKKSDDYPIYLSSTEYATGGRSVYGVLVGTISSGAIPYDITNPYNLNIVVVDKRLPGKVRPFRIADDTQKNIQFDADYAIITYTFNGGTDLDTKTRMIYPTQGVTPFTQSTYNSWQGGGPYSSNWVGYASKRPWMGTDTSTYDYTPGITSSIPAPSGMYNKPESGNNLAGTYSILWHSGDQKRSGRESVVVNLNAFKHHFPTQSEIEIECRAWWFEPNITRDVTLEIVLYKGGVISRSPSDPYLWINTGYSASYSVASYPTSVPGPSTPGSGAIMSSGGWAYATMLSKFKYNVSGKFGYLKI